MGRHEALTPLTYLFSLHPVVLKSRMEVSITTNDHHNWSFRAQVLVSTSLDERTVLPHGQEQPGSVQLTISRRAPRTGDDTWGTKRHAMRHAIHAM